MSAENIVQRHDALRGRKVLVTGGAGFIGSHIAEQLLANGAAVVRVLDNFSTGYRQNLAHLESDPRLEVVKGDIRDAGTCIRACEGMDLLCHQAAIGSVPRSIEDPLTTNDVNVGGFVNICFAAKEAGIRRIVYASSSSVYGDEPTLPKLETRTGKLLSPYAASKQTNEAYAAVFAEVYGLELVGLRYFNVFGPRQDPNGPYAAVVPRFIARMVAGEAVYIDGDGKQSRDFTYIANAVKANLLALTVPDISKGHVAVNVAAGEETTINDLFNHIAFLMEYPQAAMHGSPRSGDIRHSLADLRLASRVLGYQPSVMVADGLPPTIAYFRGLNQT